MTAARRHGTRGVDGDTRDRLAEPRSFACGERGERIGGEMVVSQDYQGAGSEPAECHQFIRGRR